MPLPPDIEQARPDDPYSSLSDAHYNTPTSIFSTFMSMLQNNTILKMSDKAEADPNIPMMIYFSYVPQVQDKLNEFYAQKPATPDEIEEAQKDRPGFQAPKGVTKNILDTMTKRWDDKTFYDFQAERPASSFAKWSGFILGGIGGSLADPAAAVGGGLVGGAAKRGLTPFAERFLERYAVSETMGSAAARLGTELTLDSLTTGASFGGFQGTEELADEAKRQSFHEPSDWLGALQRIGQTASLGAKLGAAGSVIKLGLLGYDRPILAKPEGVKEGETYTPEVVGMERVGGLLNSDALKDLPEKTKALIGRVYKPWSVEADSTAREEAMGQAINGQLPNVELNLRQGAIDEGQNFQDILKQHGVDLSDLDMRLLRADDEANLKFDELKRTVQELKESDKKLLEGNKIAIDESKDISQRGLLKQFEQAQFNRDIAQAPENLPLNINRYVDIQDQINKLNAKLDLQGENKQVQKRIEQLKKKLPKIETPKEELQGIQKRLLKNGLPENVEDLLDYKRLVDLSKVWPQARNLLERIGLEKDLSLQLKDLVGRKMVIHSMRNHINGTHDPVTDTEIKDYANHIRGLGLDNIDYDLPDTVDTTYEAQLNDFSESEIKEMLDKIDLPEFKAEIEDTIKRREAIPTLKQMAKQLVDCILRNEV